VRKAFNDLQLKTFYQRGFKVLLVDKTELSAEIVTISDRYDLVLLEAVSKLFDDSILAIFAKSS
jgi:hypothetical protein